MKTWASAICSLTALAAGMAAGMAGSATAWAQTLEPVTVRFTWKLKGEYAPLFVALDKGYYKAAGLDVQLNEGAGAKTALRQLAAEQEQVVWGPVTNAAQALGEGINVKVITIYQPLVPIGLIAHAGTKLSTPKDLEGLKFAYTTGETVADLIDPFFRLNKVDKSKVSLIQMDAGARVTQFMTKRVDVISVFTNNDLPELEKKAAAKFTVLDVGKFGLALPGAGFMTNDKQIKTRGEVLKKLVVATNKGFEDARRNPEEAATILIKAFKVPVDKDVIATQVKATADAAIAPAGKVLGWQSEDVWRSAIDLLAESGSIREKRPLADYYTNAFVE